MVIKNKRGIFFTILVIIILTLFLLSYSVFNNIQERRAIQKRIQTMNSFINSIETDLERKLFASGFRIIFLFQKHLIDSNTYIPSFNSSVENAFLNGIIVDKSTPEIITVMNGAKFSDIQSNIKLTGQKINVNITLVYNSFKITQDDPWNVKTELDTNLTIEDESNLASWNIQRTYVNYIPISNFNDPLYIIETNGKIAHNITQTPYSDLSIIANFNDHVDKTFYINTTESPSFLNRFQGLNKRSSYGIESLVNLQKLSEQGINAIDKTIADHTYFSNANPSYCQINGGSFSWIKLDSNHTTIYGVSC